MAALAADGSSSQHKPARFAERDLAACKKLTDALVHDGTDSRGEIQRSLRRHHRQRDAPFRVPFQDLIGKPRGFLAEDEMVSTLKCRVENGARCFGRQEPTSRPLDGIPSVRGCREPGVLIVRPRFMLTHTQAWPIVEPGPPAFFLAGLKPERMDEMQRTARGDACPADVPGIVRDLRLVKHDMKEGLGHARLFVTLARYACR